MEVSVTVLFLCSTLTLGVKLVSSASLKASLIGYITVWISVQKVAVLQAQHLDLIF
jgi:hypothetical protein